MSDTAIKRIANRFCDLYKERNGQKPVINYGWTGKMIKERLEDYTEAAILRIIDLYFQDEANEGKVYHLPTILSAYSFNKYLPMMRYNPDIDDNAEELNKEL